MFSVSTQLLGKPDKCMLYPKSRLTFLWLSGLFLVIRWFVLGFCALSFSKIFKLWENNVRTVTREISIIYSESAKKIFIKHNLWKQDVHVYFSIIIVHFSITIKDCFTIDLPLFVRIFNRCHSNIQSMQSQGKPA